MRAMQNVPDIVAGVVFTSGERYRIEGTVAALLLWLCRNEAAICADGVTELRVMLGGGAPRASLTRVFERVEGY